MDKDSAMLRLPNETAVGVAASNHRTMTKFDRADEQKYMPVWMSIRKLSVTALESQINLATTSGPTQARTPAISGNTTTDIILHDTNVNKRGRNGATNLHLAANFNDTETAKRLTYNGAIIDITDDFNKTPLYYALRANSRSVAQLLLDRGANLLPIISGVLLGLKESNDDNLTGLRGILRCVAPLKSPQPVLYSFLYSQRDESVRDSVFELLEARFDQDERGPHGDRRLDSALTFTGLMVMGKDSHHYTSR